MKKEEFEQFVEEPSTEIIFAVTVNKDTKREFHNIIEETGQEIDQKIENNKFVTKIVTPKKNGTLNQELILEVPDGTVLEYDAVYGYKELHRNVCKLEDAFITLEAQKNIIKKYNEKGE